MRPALLVLLLAAPALAGCADVSPDPPASTREPTVPTDVLVARPADRSWWTLLDAAFAFGPDRPAWTAPVTIPNGTVQVVVNLTLHEGAARDLRLRLGTCARDFPGAAPATGQTLGVDCGGLWEGEDALTLDGGGLLRGRAEVGALVCGPPARGCHRAPPPDPGEP